MPGLSREHVGRISFTNQGKQLVTRRTEPFLPMVLRSELDHQLVQIAEAAGVSVMTGTTVGAYQEQEGVVILGTSRGPVRAAAVVGADGSASRASGYVGVVCDQVDIGL
ncbi:MAG: geranylgeranyl reductase, partial [Frankiales bacterium]|nr:geranylgeranyl reductase [Frankiales bacterium]